MNPRTPLAFFASLPLLAGCISVMDLGHNDFAMSGSGAGSGGGGSGPTSGSTGSTTTTGSTTGGGVGGGACVPAPEQCATPADENCDGLTPDCSGAHLWSAIFGDASEQEGIRIAVDSMGAVYLAGDFTGTINLGGGSLKATAGGYDLFVAKFDAKGSPVWSKSYAGTGDEIPADIAIDETGAVYVTGNFTNTINLGSGATLTSAGGTDLFLAKLSGANGVTVWANRYGDSGNATARGLAVDTSGNPVLAGHFTSSINFGGGALTSAGGDDIFVAKLNASGVQQWAHNYGDSGYQEAYGLAVDTSGNVVIVGALAGSTTFGSLATLTSAGGYDAFVAKLNSSGVPQWSKRFGDGNAQRASSVGVDASGAIYLTGTMGTSIDLGAGAVTGAMFAAKLGTSTGAHQWSKGYAVGIPQMIAVDGAGNPVIVGGTAATGDALALKLDGSTGSTQWSKTFGDSANQAAFGVAFDIGANVYLTGWAEGTIDLGGGGLKSAGGRDAWIAKLAP